MSESPPPPGPPISAPSAGPPDPPAPRRPSTRLSGEDRARQLVGIGLAKLRTRPLHGLSVDEVAVEAGISRGLLFHYFPTKADYFRALVEAAGRRVLHNARAAPQAPPGDQVRQMVAGLVQQIRRRRAAYVSFARGAAGGSIPVAAAYDAVREELTDRVLGALERGPGDRDLVHAWWAYVEDRALEWSGRTPAPAAATAERAVVTPCLRALEALLAAGTG